MGMRNKFAALFVAVGTLLVGAATLHAAPSGAAPAAPLVRPTAGCTALFDWFSVTTSATSATAGLNVPDGCAPFDVVLDGWPLGVAWPAGPVPGDHAEYATYAKIRQGPQTQRVVRLRAGRNVVTFDLGATPTCTWQLDASIPTLDGRPLYPVGTVIDGTPDYGDLLVPTGAWIAATVCVIPTTTTSTPATTTSAPPSSTTTSAPVPSTSTTAPAVTTTTASTPVTSAPPAPVVACNGPAGCKSLPATGSNTAPLGKLGGLLVAAGAVLMVFTRHPRTAGR